MYAKLSSDCHTLFNYCIMLLIIAVLYCEIICALLRGKWNLIHWQVGHWNVNLQNWSIYIYIYIYILVNFEFSEISCHDDPGVQNFDYLEAFGNNRANGLDARRMSCARYFYRAIPSLALSYDFWIFKSTMKWFLLLKKENKLTILNFHEILTARVIISFLHDRSN